MPDISARDGVRLELDDGEEEEDDDDDDDGDMEGLKEDEESSTAGCWKNTERSEQWVPHAE